MKALIITIAILLIYSCATKNTNTVTAPKFKILYEAENGGAEIEFYETITERKEINMLLNDPNLKEKIKAADIETANFVLLSFGQKNTGGYAISVSKVEETKDNMVVYIHKKNPKPREIVTQALTNPFCIVKINSKKEIIFKEN